MMTTTTTTTTIIVLDRCVASAGSYHWAHWRDWYAVAWNRKRGKDQWSSAWWCVEIPKLQRSAYQRSDPGRVLFPFNINCIGAWWRALEVWGRWCGEDEYKENFISSDTWHLLRGRKEEVRWSKLVWFPQGVPRYGFIPWLAIRGRLATGHRTRQWGQMQCCVYCGEPDETRDHLFFPCPYTFTLCLNV